MSRKGQAKWETYEEVARDLMERIGDHLGLKYVEGKQKLMGKATDWEIDAKGVKANDQGIVVIECRRYTTSRINQKDMASFAYTIEDLGGAGGILVSPMEPQKGAKEIAAAHGIQHVRLNPEATSTDYVLMLDFLNRAFIGVSDTFTMSEDAHVVVQEEADREE